MFTDIQKRMLRYVSQKLASGKRADDLLVLRDLIQTGCAAPVRSRMSVAACLTNRFVVAQQRKTFADCVFLEERDGREGGGARGGTGAVGARGCAKSPTLAPPGTGKRCDRCLGT